MKTITCSIFLSLALNSIFAQDIPPDSLYLGQTRPGISSILFDLPFGNYSIAMERMAISNDGKEIYYGLYNSDDKLMIKYFRYSDDTWNGPNLLFEGFIAPAFSPGGDTMFLQKSDNYYAYYSIKNGENWSNPSLFWRGKKIHYLQITNSGNYYASSDSAIGVLGANDISKMVINGSDTAFYSLGVPLNSPGNEGDFYIARDESFIIFASPDRGGFGIGDLFISYRKEDDTGWTNPKNLGSLINTSFYEFGPYVTADNKYLFFPRGTGPITQYYYWVQTDKLIDSLKNTNFAPYLKHQIKDQTIRVGEFYSFSASDTLFFDDDGYQTLTYTASLSNGSDLPGWLNFDPETLTLSGTPEAADNLNLRITATDTADASVSDYFILHIKDPSSVTDINTRVFTVYPVPAYGSLTIQFENASPEKCEYYIMDEKGATIKQGTLDSASEIDISALKKGIYFVRVVTDNCDTTQKIIIE